MVSFVFFGGGILLFTLSKIVGTEFFTLLLPTVLWPGGFTVHSFNRTSGIFQPVNSLLAAQCLQNMWPFSKNNIYEETGQQESSQKIICTNNFNANLSFIAEIWVASDIFASLSSLFLTVVAAGNSSSIMK